MKHCFLCISISISILLFSCQKSDPGPKEMPTVPQLGALNLVDYEISDLPGSDLQKAIKKNESGVVLEEGLLKHGKRHGAWVIYHEKKETPFRIINFEDDIFSGIFLEYSHLGQLELIANYMNNELDGRWIKYYRGFKTETRQYKNGQLNGLLEKYYEGLDIVQQASYYKDDKLNGVSKFYDQKGGLLEEVNYSEGERK